VGLLAFLVSVRYWYFEGGSSPRATNATPNAMSSVAPPSGARRASSTAPAVGRPRATSTVADLFAKNPLLAGDNRFQVMQASGTWPQIIQSDINPLDIAPGQIQELSIIVKDPEPIVSVEARIETDHGTVTVPLSLVGPTGASELLPARYAVLLSGELAFAEAPTLTLADAVRSFVSRVVNAFAPRSAGAQTAEPAPQTYRGSWKVRDTHSTTYRTMFVARDAAGRENSVTLAWSDWGPCGTPDSGDWVMNYNCTLYPGAPYNIDGADHGNVIIQSGTLTIPNGTAFAFNSGYHISLTGGSIVIGTGGQIKKTNLWLVDADYDGYDGGGMVAADSSPGGNYMRRYGSLGEDCDDWDENEYQDWDVEADNDGDGHGAGEELWVCGGGSVPEGYSEIWDDCYDGNGDTYPGSDYWGGDRGDGSGDYNCDGETTKLYGDGFAGCEEGYPSYYCTFYGCGPCEEDVSWAWDGWNSGREGADCGVEEEWYSYDSPYECGPCRAHGGYSEYLTQLCN